MRTARRLDWERQADAAEAAFARNGFLLLVGDRQIEDLDTEIDLIADPVASFVKLVPLSEADADGGDQVFPPFEEDDGMLSVIPSRASPPSPARPSPAGSTLTGTTGMNLSPPPSACSS